MSTINNNTFGDTKDYPVLESLTHMIFNLDEHKRGYISKFIIRLNTDVKNANSIMPLDFRKYTLRLIREDYKNKVDEIMVDKYSKDICTRLRNYIHSVTKRTSYVNRNNRVKVKISNIDENILNALTPEQKSRIAKYITRIIEKPQ